MSFGGKWSEFSWNIELKRQRPTPFLKEIMDLDSHFPSIGVHFRFSIQVYLIKGMNYKIIKRLDCTLIVWRKS